MTIKQSLIAATAAILLTAGAARVPALAHDHGGWHGGEGMEILHSLNLTDAQKAQVHSLAEAARGQAGPIMAQMRAVHEQMASALLASGTVTADQVQPMVTQEEQLKSQLDQIHLNTVLQIRALLTPEQVTQAAATHTKLAALHEQEDEALRGDSQ